MCRVYIATSDSGHNRHIAPPRGKIGPRRRHPTASRLAAPAEAAAEFIAVIPTAGGTVIEEVLTRLIGHVVYRKALPSSANITAGATNRTPTPASACVVAASGLHHGNIVGLVPASSRAEGKDDSDEENYGEGNTDGDPHPSCDGLSRGGCTKLSTAGIGAQIWVGRIAVGREIGGDADVAAAPHTNGGHSHRARIVEVRHILGAGCNACLADAKTSRGGRCCGARFYASLAVLRDEVATLDARTGISRRHAAVEALRVTCTAHTIAAVLITTALEVAPVTSAHVGAVEALVVGGTEAPTRRVTFAVAGMAGQRHGGVGDITVGCTCLGAYARGRVHKVGEKTTSQRAVLEGGTVT